jgi:hypothetical protein
MGIGVANRAAAIGLVSCAVLCGGKGTWGSRGRAPRHAPARSGREAGRGFARATSDMLLAFLFFVCHIFYSVASAGPRGLMRLGGETWSRADRVLLVTLARPRVGRHELSGPGGPALAGATNLF